MKNQLVFNSEMEERILNILRSNKGSECACSTCSNMCKTCPCLGTPADIKRIIEAGHRSKLCGTTWAAGLVVGLPEIKMVTPRRLENGHCAFLTENNLCSLHEAGLKPTEGKLTSSHEIIPVSRSKPIPLGFLAAFTWLFEAFKNEKKFCFFFTN